MSTRLVLLWKLKRTYSSRSKTNIFHCCTDIHERCNGNVHIAITEVWPKARPRLISQFRTRKDLIDTLLVSCHIPW